MGTKRKMVDSGVEWIGEVPEGWRITRITDEYIVSAGIGAPQDAEPFQEGLLPFVRVSDLAKNPGRLVKETRDGVSVSYSQHKQKAGTLVFPKSGESIRTGARKLLHMDSVVVGHLACVTSRTSGTNMDYGYYLFNAFDFEDELNQTALPALNLSAIQSKRIPLPSAHEQADIATFLDHHVDLIDRERELIAQKIGLLKDKRKALIFECVTGKRTIVEAQHLAGVDDWTDIVGSGPLVAVPTAGKDDPFVKGGRLVDSGVEWIGEVPEDWGTQKIKDIAKVKKGTQIDFGPDDHPGFFPYQNGGISPSFYSSRQNTPENTIAISEGGASAGHVQLMHTPFWCGGHCYAVSGTEKAPTRHLYWMLKAAETQLKENKTGTAMPNLKSGELLNLSVPMPSNPTQTLISDFLDHQTTLIDQEIDLLETKSSLLADKRKALIFEAVTGKIDCTQP